MNEIKKTRVIGAGTMGHGIAQVFAHAGCDVILTDMNREILDAAKSHIEVNLKFLAGYNLVDESAIPSIVGRISFLTNEDNIPADAELIIEAVPEYLDLKQKVLTTAESESSGKTILSSTTSVIQVTDIGEPLDRPEQFIGMHWMNPPHVLPLVEIIPGPTTSKDVIAQTKSFLEDQCMKKTVVCGDAPGFIVNRLAAAVLVEAAKMIEDGIATFEDIDRAWKEHMGYILLKFRPFGNIDHIGLDVITMAANYLAFVLEDERYRPPSWMQEKVNAGDLGTKTGKGVYDYPGKTPEELRIERIQKLLDLIKKNTE
jgi:3-hydroxyacyl-CoA dehydrogenase